MRAQMPTVVRQWHADFGYRYGDPANAPSVDAMARDVIEEMDPEHGDIGAAHSMLGDVANQLVQAGFTGTEHEARWMAQQLLTEMAL